MAIVNKKVIIIRHAEKPGDPSIDSPEDSINLSPRGYERAGALAAYIPATFGKPDFLFATKESHHGKIPALTTALGGNPPFAHWPGDIFDRVWQIDYPDANDKPNGLPVSNLPQKLLYGDSDT